MSVHYILVGLVCLAIASVVSCSGVGSPDGIAMCLESEREALLEFKQGLVDKFNTLASWKSETDCCKWRGIACNNQTGHVTTLDLSTAAPLRGEIHPSLLALRYLNVLDLSWIDFGGMTIPEFIGSLSHLKQLKLVDANFSGHVPPHLGNLSKLHTLDLFYNDQVRVENLEWLSHLSSLKYLSMSFLNLSKAVDWPLSLSNLTSLTELQLSSCYLPNVNLRSFFNRNFSPSLQVLDLSFNQLEGGVSKAFSNLCTLRSLNLRSNLFSENIEDSLRTLSCAHNTLESLDLSVNQFFGSFPDFTGFTNLRSLACRVNKLNGSLPESLGQLSSLEQLDFSENLFTGVLTESLFQNLPRLQSLSLLDNHFSINLGSDWVPPFQLTGILNMSNYKFGGPGFPKWILTQTNLTSLFLFNCGLSGSLPNEFWDIFSSLQRIDLSTNQLRGNLPNLTSVTMLHIVDCRIGFQSSHLPFV